METGNESRMKKAKKIGFDNLSYDIQRVVFNKARMFGWDGDIPSVFGNYYADSQLNYALDYLVRKGVVFRKEGGLEWWIA